MMKELLWNILATMLAWPPISRWLIARAHRTPYFPIMKDGRTYMDRHWLFNPYGYETRQAKHGWCPISIRVHHIQMPDDDRHLHDHPWNARTIILDGWYVEQRPDGVRVRSPGETASLAVGEYHRIALVGQSGAHTLFITGRYLGTWGFLVDGVKVPWRQHLRIREPFRLDLAEHIARQQRFSEATFGPGGRAQGVVDHIRKELREIEAEPGDLEEWIDVATLAFDGAWRAGHSPEDVARAFQAKLIKNESRTWPDWRTADRNKAIEHDRSREVIT